MFSRRTLMAVAVASFGIPAAFAAEPPDEGLIVVTATRFTEADVKIPANVTIISRQDISTSTATNLPDLLQSYAGITTTSLFGSMGAFSTVDLRGFGEAATNNTLILIDGQRLNPINNEGINWSIVPLANVQRVEIIRGSGAVLYGDRATGGVINIITDKSNRDRASVSVTAGSYGHRGAEASIGGAAQSLYYNLRALHENSDGYRSNNQSDQDNLSGRLGVRSGDTDGFIDFSAYRDSTGLPGALFSQQFDEDPLQTRKPFDVQNHEGYRLRPGVSMPLTPTLTLNAETGVHRETLYLSSPGFVNKSERETLSLTPRLRWQHGIGSTGSETVIGADFYRGEITNESVFTSTFGVFPNVQTASQKSSAVYLQNMTSLPLDVVATVGARRQRMVQEANDRANAVGGETDRTRGSYEFGLNWSIDEQWRLFGKTGQAYRFANTDELFGFDQNSVFAGDLKPQRGTNQEFGTSWNARRMSVRMNVYRLDLHDEIAFNGDTGNNENLPETRRQGIETEFEIKPTDILKINLAYAYQQAEFRAGPDAGNTLPMAATNKASLRAHWNLDAAGQYGMTVNYVGSRRGSGDYANIRNELPAHTVVDLQAAWKIGAWTLATKMLNAFDKKYAPFGGFSTFNNDYFFYPADGRSFLASLRYDLK